MEETSTKREERLSDIVPWARVIKWPLPLDVLEKCRLGRTMWVDLVYEIAVNHRTWLPVLVAQDVPRCVLELVCARAEPLFMHAEAARIDAASKLKASPNMDDVLSSLRDFKALLHDASGHDCGHKDAGR